MLRRKKTGQSTAEYAIVIGLVIAAAVAMQVYVKRGIQAKIKGVVDYQPDKMFTTGQYEPDYATSDMNSTRNMTQKNEDKGAGLVERTLSQDSSLRSGTQNTAALSNATTH